MSERALFLLSGIFLAALLPGIATAQEGRDAMRRYGCGNCHEVEGLRVSRERSCTGCHQRLARRRHGFGRGAVVRHFIEVPDLRGAGRRLREDYLIAYLQDPHDVRPRLEETMPRLPVTETDARAIARFLRADAPRVAPSPALDRANIEPGRAVFQRVGCAICHEFGNVPSTVHVAPEALVGLGRAAFEGPNLRFLRDRMDPDVAVAWLENPRAIDPETQMPPTNLSRPDAILLRDFLFLADPGRPAAPPTPRADLRPLQRPVSFREVERIIGGSCVHCHAHTDGRSASALGFTPSSLDLSSAEGIRAGVRYPDGTTRSIIEPDESGVPPLVRRLLLRHEEATRDMTSPQRDPMSPVVRPRPDGPVGMPLGLPPIDVDQIRAIATWIARGAPG